MRFAKMNAEILISGFGGQGVMSLGKFLSRVALAENKYTSWFPTYGAEVRGGTAHCYVKISTRPIASPLIENPDIAIILNQPSLDKFEKKLKKACLLILNTDLIGRKLVRKDIQPLLLPLNKVALSCKNARVANTVALGALISLRPNLIGKKTVIKVLKEIFSDNAELLEQNLCALSSGERLANANHR